ncbi:MAG: 2-amino-4-hydroxy-6-hydroxymethyldihydropteridine diphosphokinase [Pseudoxanthomonas sp.]
MNAHRYVLLLGSSVAEELLRRAVEALAGAGAVEAVSDVVHGPSVVAGDGRHFFNMAVRLRSALDRAALLPTIKRIERELGRAPGAAQCAIDIDLAMELDAHGRVLWEAPDKLAAPLFRRLAGAVRIGR